MSKVLKALFVPIMFAFALYLLFGLLPAVFSGNTQLNPVFVTVGGLQIKWYGLLIACGILLAYLMSSKELKKDGFSESTSDSLILITVLSGVIGARLGFVLQSTQYYFSTAHYMEIFKIWDGGLSIHGALIVGALAIYIFCKSSKLNILTAANDIAPSVFLAGAIGRWGNFFNYEIIGKPTNIIWKMFVPAADRPIGFEAYSYFHPVFLYESLLLALALIIYLVFKKSLKQYAFAYTLVFYSLARIIVEFWRIDYKPIFSFLDFAQLISLFIIVLGVGIYFYQKKHQ